MQNLVRRLTQKIEEEIQGEPRLSGQEPTYCDICYTNEIVAPDDTINVGDKTTMEFSCKHRFC